MRHNKSGVTVGLMCLFLGAASGPACCVTCFVPATADLYLAGQASSVTISDTAFGTSDSAPGQAAFEVAGVPLTAGTSLTFAATGLAGNDPAPFSGPDGGMAGWTSYDPVTGIGTVGGAPRNQVQPVPFALSGHSNIPLVSMIGVFTGEQVPEWGTVSNLPLPLDFGSSSLGTDFETLSPELRQVFFIGDGFTSVGAAQKFRVPIGAKHLCLGISDGPGAYANNGGGFGVNVQVAPGRYGPMVSGVQARQLSDESRKVEIDYDLADPDSATVYVSVAISTDGGSTYTITPTSITGDTGWVRPGGKRTIIWDAKADYPDAVWSSCRARVTADDTSGGVYPGEMVYIPAGSFLMGNSGVGDDGVYGSSNELPQHSVYLSGYWIGKYEVTRGEYRQFINAGGYSNPAYWSSDGWSWKVSNSRTQPSYWATQQDWASLDGYPPQPFTQSDNHPVVGVTYYEAEAFCNWAGGHLPTEAEWEKPARWTGSSSRVYPWGNAWDEQRCNNWSESLYPGYQTAPVGSYPTGVSPYGCHDMAGNVWERCKDWYSSSYYSQTPGGGWINPQGPTSGSSRILRGGSWNNNFRHCRCGERDSGFGPYDAFSNVGFRLAR